MTHMTRSRFLSILLLALVAALPATAGPPLPDCLADAREGEWVLYRLEGGMQQRQSVTAVRGDTVTLRTEILMDGETVSSTETKVSKKARPELPEGEEIETERATITIQGRKIDCVAVRSGKTRSYVSNQIPVTGLARSEVEGRVLLEAVDYGHEK